MKQEHVAEYLVDFILKIFYWEELNWEKKTFAHIVNTT